MNIPKEKIKEVLFNILTGCSCKDIERYREGIFNSETCKLFCFEETLESGILTAKEREVLENLEDREIRKLLRSAVTLDENMNFDRSRLLHLSSGFSLQDYTVKIPTAVTQMKLRMLQLFLEPLPYKRSYRHSYGPGGKKRLEKMEQGILTALVSYPFGFKVRLQVSDSGHYLRTLKDILPLPDEMIDSLVESGNVTVRQLFPETAGLTVIPFLEEYLLPFWFVRFIQKVTRKACKVFHYRDSLLVLCKDKEEVKEALDRFLEAMPAFGIKFDYDSLIQINTEEGFSFLGKNYEIEGGNSFCKPEPELFGSFLEYVFRIAESPVVPMSELREQFNLVILCLNLYYRGFSEELREDLFKTVTVGLYKRYGNKSLGEIQSTIFETGVNLKKHFKPVIFGGIGLDELISEEDFKNGTFEIVNVSAPEDILCPLCRRPLNKGEQSVVINYGKKSWTVHIDCSDSVYEILKNLRFYPGIFPFERECWKEILDGTRDGSKRKLKTIDSGWEYYPLYEYFRKQKKKLVRINFSKIENILGFKLHEQQKRYDNIIALPDGNNLELADAWEAAGYRLKPLRNPEKFNGSLTFERKETSDNEVLNHPLMKKEATAQIQKDLTELIQRLIDSRK